MPCRSQLKPFFYHSVTSTHRATRATCHVSQTEDTLVHVQWFERTATGRADAPEEDTIVFPGEAVLEKVGPSQGTGTCVIMWVELFSTRAESQQHTHDTPSSCMR